MQDVKPSYMQWRQKLVEKCICNEWTLKCASGKDWNFTWRVEELGTLFFALLAQKVYCKTSFMWINHTKKNTEWFLFQLHATFWQSFKTHYFLNYLRLYMVKIVCTSVLQVSEQIWVLLLCSFHYAFFHKLLSSVIVLCFITFICTFSYTRGLLDPKYYQGD